MTPLLLITRIAQTLAAEPARVHVECVRQNIRIITIKRNMGRLVGRDGATIYAIQKLGEYFGYHVHLEEPSEAAQAEKTLPSIPPLEIIRAFAAMRKEKIAINEGPTEAIVTGWQFPPEICDALGLLAHHVGRITTGKINVLWR